MNKSDSQPAAGAPGATRPALPGADLVYFPDAGLAEPDDLLQRLLASVEWTQQTIRLFGKSHPQPRLEAWYGEPGASYSYSGIQHEPLPWNADLLPLRRSVEAICGRRFNSVLLNWYRDGNDYMGLHADDEPELGNEPCIASLSLGATRRMYFRHRRDATIGTFSLDLASGSLLIMQGATQQNYKHGIRKTARPCGPRINLTFRWVAARDDQRS
ncbi:MAG: alpha-ketoglutarate-dependent dioxygenase AlkB [Halioglobus sp.]|nr:alpha-ketoglutarate-dependent dioxygenase AlkB [Halioglobus sp.]